MYQDAIKNAQRVFRGEAGYRGRIDGVVGRQTLAAAHRAPGIDAIEAVRGAIPPERRVILAAQIFLSEAGFDAGAPDGFWGPQTDAAFSTWRGDAMPVRGTDLAHRFGPAGGAQCTAGRVVPPWAMVLAWDQGTPVRVIRCHALVAASAQAAFDDIARAYSAAQIRDLGLDQFGGCFNFRKMRGGSALSTHAYGVAMDFDPVRNQLRWGADRARLGRADARRFWDIWADHGWVSLGRARDFDWMHVQAVGL